MIFEFRETFARKFPKLKELVVSNLTQVQEAVSKTGIANTAVVSNLIQAPIAVSKTEISIALE